jgi:hypothetical protein
MWHKFLSQWNVTSFFLDDDITNGKLNSIADAISRFQMDKFRKLAPDADKEAIPHPTVGQITM